MDALPSASLIMKLSAIGILILSTLLRARLQSRRKPFHMFLVNSLQLVVQDIHRFIHYRGLTWSTHFVIWNVLSTLNLLELGSAFLRNMPTTPVCLSAWTARLSKIEAPLRFEDSNVLDGCCSVLRCLPTYYRCLIYSLSSVLLSPKYLPSSLRFFHFS